MQPIINIASRAVRHAGEFLQQFLQRQEYSQESLSRTLETIPRIEQQIHKTLLQSLKKTYHDHYVAELGETELSAKPIAWSVQPVINPLAFARGLPSTLLSLTCLHNGKPEHVVLFNPVTGDEYTASRGDGATLNGKRVRVGTNHKFETSVVSANLFNSPRNLDNHAVSDLHKDILKSSLAMASSGCAALDLLNLASGKLDCVIDLNIDLYELSPSLLFCREAGVLYADISGTPISHESNNIVAANPKLFKAAVQKLYTYRGRL